MSLENTVKVGQLWKIVKPISRRPDCKEQVLLITKRLDPDGDETYIEYYFPYWKKYCQSEESLVLEKCVLLRDA